ncbi:DNA-directed RNA polymerase subunit omega [Natroniella sulfidigena]|uniref:DNA-directed RNA polymerase subunit omega n=1 Tax=Natroniella sulfidigena TaxID=723921 RepID=UPI00200A45D6|nr:DNA-directed RNA polymerase subunit omega [Natroniella sulfidigena]MCK8818216.1 DNA-directed RNA polymerase subunit omega [Natroniella sulfidigena]
MLARPEMGDILEKCDAVFTAVVVSSKRARLLKEGEEELLDEYKGSKEVSKALEEIVAGKVRPKKDN